MSERKTTIIRADKEFKKLIDDVLERKSRKVTTARVTLAMTRQYKKYPLVLKELLDSEMK